MKPLRSLFSTIVLVSLLWFTPYATAFAKPVLFDWFEYRGADPAHDGELAPSEYFNPILAGFYPDPSVLRVGEDYYVVSSTFAYFPGIPIFHSKDLVNWTQIGNAIDRPSQLNFGSLGLSRGVFAPTIEHRDGRYYIFNTCVDCGDNFVITADNPAGPWSDPVWLPDLVGGIDPAVFFDDDGSAWIVNNGPPSEQPRYPGHRAIWIQRFDAEKLKTFGPRKVIVNGGVDLSKKPIWIEGPSIIRRNGWYYLICAEGGTAEGHSQVVLRSRAPDGPYEAHPGNPILTQRDLPRDRPLPITSAGHADLVQTPAGDWWATFLAVRPYGDDLYNTGRETFLMPVDWSGEWPRITAPGQAIPYRGKRPQAPAPSTPTKPMTGSFVDREEFDAPTLPPSWMMLRNPKEIWYDLVSHRGALSLQPRAVSLGERGNPSFLGRRQQHVFAQASTSMRWRPERDGDAAGLVALQNDEHWFSITATRDAGRAEIQVRRRAGASEPTHGVVIDRAALPRSRGPIRFRIDARAGAYDFSYAVGRGPWTTIVRDADGTILSTKKAGGFVGVTFGPYAFAGPPTSGR